MKKFVCTMLLLLMFSSFVASAEEVTIEKNPIEISAKSAIVIDVNTKEILYEKNAYEKLSMASTTKVMTAIVACDYIEQNGDIQVTITDEMANVEGSSMGLSSGDKINLSGLIVGMLLPSGNDAANSVAIATYGSLQNFALAMNEKAKEIGMENTSFVTPSGLDDDMHYTNAFDMALLMAYSKNYSLVSEIMKSQSREITYYCVKYDKELTISLENHNKLLSTYQFCDGGKTGYTQKSGRTLISSATKDDYSLVAVTLNAGDDWNDHQKMYDYCFSKIKDCYFQDEIISIATAEGENVNLKTEFVHLKYFDGQTIERKIFLPKFIYYASYKQGDVVGKINYYIDGKITKTKYILKE